MQLLKVKYDKLHSSFAFNVNLRPYSMDAGKDISFAIMAADVENNEYTTSDITFTVTMTPSDTLLALGVKATTVYSTYTGGPSNNRFEALLPGEEVNVVGWCNLK